MDTSDLQPEEPHAMMSTTFQTQTSQQSLKCLMPRKLWWKPLCTQWYTEDVVFELVNDVFSSWIKATAYVVIWSWGYANSKARSLQIAGKWTLLICSPLILPHPGKAVHWVLWIIWDDFINRRTVSTRINQGCESSGTNTYFSPTFGKGNNILNSVLGRDMSW